MTGTPDGVGGWGPGLQVGPPWLWGRLVPTWGHSTSSRRGQKRWAGDGQLQPAPVREDVGQSEEQHKPNGERPSGRGWPPSVCSPGPRTLLTETKRHLRAPIRTNPPFAVCSSPPLHSAVFRLRGSPRPESSSPLAPGLAGVFPTTPKGVLLTPTPLSAPQGPGPVTGVQMHLNSVGTVRPPSLTAS